MFGKVENGTIQRKKKSNDSRSRSTSNNQHNSHKSSTNKPIEIERKEWLTPAEASKEKRRKKKRKIKKLKNRFTCDSFNFIYVVICDKC